MSKTDTTLTYCLEFTTSLLSVLDNARSKPRRFVSGRVHHDPRRHKALVQSSRHSQTDRQIDSDTWPLHSQAETAQRSTVCTTCIIVRIRASEFKKSILMQLYTPYRLSHCAHLIECWEYVVGKLYLCNGGGAGTSSSDAETRDSLFTQW